MRRYPGGLPDDAVAQLIAIADEVFAELAIPKAALALWRPRFRNARRAGSSDSSASARGDIAQSHAGNTRRADARRTGGDFTLTRRRRPHRHSARTAAPPSSTTRRGKPPSKPQVERIAGAATAAGRRDAGGGRLSRARARATAEELLYLHISGRRRRRQCAIHRRRAASDRRKRWRSWRARIAWFDDPATPYLPRVRPFSADMRRRLRPSGAGARMVAVRLEEERMSASLHIASDPQSVRLGRGQCRRGQDLHAGQPRGAAAAGRCAGRRKSSASPSPRRRRRRCSTGCSSSWANGRCCRTRSCARRSPRSAPMPGRSAQGAPPVRQGAGDAGRTEDPDPSRLLPDRAVALSPRGGRAARLRRAGRRSRRAT